MSFGIFLLCVLAWWVFGVILTVVMFLYENDIEVDDIGLIFCCGIIWPYIIYLFVKHIFNKNTQRVKC